MRFSDLPDVQQVLPGIVSRAQELDQSGDWPVTDLQVLATLGAMRWSLPLSATGEELAPIEMHFRYEAIASSSVSVALALSQRDSAADLIDGATEWAKRDEILHQLAKNEIWSTVGIAQLTTSRQGSTPALRAVHEGDGYRIDGIIPWATGAAQSDFIIAGAALPDGQQILFALPAKLPGVSIEPPLTLVALRASWTAQINCVNVLLGNEWILRGPVEKALVGRKKGIALSQVFLAMGLACGAINLVNAHESELARGAGDRFDKQLTALRRQVLDLCAPGREADAAREAPRLRGAINDLVLRITHTAVALYKGSGLLANHPAQRLAREAMFLLVWSCPGSVIECTVDRLSEDCAP